MGKKVIPGNGRATIALIFGPDAHALRLAGSMALATLPFSPMAVGVHSPGGSNKGFTGDPGYGVNRMGGRTDPMQFFAGAAAATKPVRDPKSRRLGIGAMPSGQPGMPGTGTDDNPLAGFGGQLRTGWA
ncbi:hypothetical protein [Phytohabitans rumicis]|uniref:Uncharacterized protein n=1 Tax=Phytohabitans rumicis TaxID=1076125 RepID=A0A6V8LA42_9ACTN|nr:hypothetical protein [Phytohabitans rumicis]GFJ92480.1 hypothetical protein Prum_061220 [Phytohabitans rumicis]